MNVRGVVLIKLLWVITIVAVAYAAVLAYRMIYSHSYNLTSLLAITSLLVGAGLVWMEVRKVRS